MAAERIGSLVAPACKAVAAQHHRAHVRATWLQRIPSFLSVSFIGLILVVAAGCSSNKTQTISESYVQSVVDLNNGLVVHVGDVSRLASATSALQQADGLIRQAVKRRDEALRSFSEVNADFDAAPEQLNSLVTTSQSANTTDVEALIGLITTFQSSLTTQELVALYPERAEFATQTLLLLDEH